MDKIDNIEELKELASLIRQDIVKMLSAAGSGHTGGSLGLTDIFTVLYFNILNHDPEKPIWPERDRLILSNGHIVPVRYATMARAGYFSITKLKSLRKLGSFLQGHPSLHDFPAMECSGGPLGQGISVSVGMALAAKLNKEKHHIYCTVGDGELNEGQCWEGFMMAAKNKLNNLTFIIDRNNIQIDGPTDKVMPLDSLANKLRAFNLDVKTINGHNYKQLLSELKIKGKNKPKAIIAKTIPGKGVSFMENKYEWHGIAPNEEELVKALNELKYVK
ncbi:transketolase [bacterium]|jgi:transketolase|nr:transketolase [bacterium]MBT4122145.1 transketolase [bacterium]MBT4334977.1 transketolase [bacterium]MBT4496036.1 transketolase [bacterium]MBT4764035.1 transketolase [bacterium]